MFCRGDQCNAGRVTAGQFVHTAAAAPEPHPLDPALLAAHDSLHHIQSHVRDYTAIMTKRCRVNGRLSDHQQAFVKIRNRRVRKTTSVVDADVGLREVSPPASDPKDAK